MVSEPLKKLETTKGKKPLKGAISCACVIWLRLHLAFRGLPLPKPYKILEHKRPMQP